MTVGSQVKQTVAALMGIETTLKIYATQSEDNEIKNAFSEAANTTQEVINNLEDRLTVLEFQEPQYKGF
jgi:predicted DNA-binding protein YlxM (UPF0122 family)